MEIVSKIVEIKAKVPVNNNFIENELAKMGIIPLRWAIVNVESDNLTISLACENL